MGRRLGTVHAPQMLHTRVNCGARQSAGRAGARARAECSESAGRMLTPCSRASGSTYGPPAISVSLLARQMSLPALMAATVGCSPAQPARGPRARQQPQRGAGGPSQPHKLPGRQSRRSILVSELRRRAPTMPVTTASASGCRATSTAPSSPTRISGCRGASRSSSRSSASLPASRIATSAGWNCRTCCASSCTLPPAASATSSKRSLCSAMMSSVCVPMDPGAPHGCVLRRGLRRGCCVHACAGAQPHRSSPGWTASARTQHRSVSVRDGTRHAWRTQRVEEQRAFLPELGFASCTGTLPGHAGGGPDAALAHCGPPRRSCERREAWSDCAH